MKHKLISFILTQIIFGNIYLANIDSSDLDILATECRGCPCMLNKKHKIKTKQLSIQKKSAKKETHYDIVINKVSPEHMQLKMDAAPVLISVIPPEFHAKWRIPGAINIPLDMLEKELKNWKRDKEIILYCFIGRTSSYAFEILTAMGFTNLSTCEGGIKNWVKSGHKMEGTGTYSELLSTINEIKKQLKK